MGQVRISQPVVDDIDVDEVVRVLRSGMLASGQLVERLERNLATQIGVRHAVAVSSGTAALHCAMHALGVGPGSEVITTPFTFVGSVNPAIMQGARLRFADIRLDDYGPDVAQLQSAVTERTAAVVVVDLYGEPVDDIGDISNRAGSKIPVVEDACQALGGRSSAGSAGALFDVGCFSFYATKNVTCGEGGALVTDDDQLAAAARRFRQHGMTGPYEYAELGYNYRLTDIHAAIAVHQLSRVESITDSRAHNAAALTAGLRDVRGLVLPTVRPGVRHAWHQYVVRVTEEFGLTRDATLASLAERGVHAAVYYPKPLTEYAHVRAATDGPLHFPNAERAAREVLALPVHPALSGSDIDRTIDALRGLSE